MNWEKLGLIFNVNKNFDWMQTHASLPIPIQLKGDLYKIYFSTRDISNRSHGAYIDIDLTCPKEIIKISPEPVLTPGDLGLFDDSGVSLSCFVKKADLFYYTGWNLMKTVPFSNQIGVAQASTDILKKVKGFPVLAKSENEPFSLGDPWVIYHDNKFKMWYGNNKKWNGTTNNDYLFNIRYAESLDGIVWDRKYVDCMVMEKGEKSLARPCVIFENNIFKMWYCINVFNKYKMGYAESKDGISWIRKDKEVGITTSDSGWDGEEIEYPCVFDHKGERYMLYNGNGYGKTGFGLARLIKANAYNVK